MGELSSEDSESLPELDEELDSCFLAAFWLVFLAGADAFLAGGLPAGFLPDGFLAGGFLAAAFFGGGFLSGEESLLLPLSLPLLPELLPDSLFSTGLESTSLTPQFVN